MKLADFVQYDGQRGVELAMKILIEEFRRTMALSGCVKVSDITSDFVRDARYHPMSKL